MRWVFLLTTLFAVLATAQAQVRTELGGHVEATLGAETTGDLVAADADAMLALDGEVGSELFPTADFRTELHAESDGVSGEADIRLGEAWGRVFLDDVEITLGNQRRFWGSTDGVNPVDRLNPRDRSVPVDDDKLAVPMVDVRAYLPHDLSLEAVVIPVFVPSTQPGEAWREDPEFTPPSGVQVTEILPLREERPDTELGNVQFGVRGQWRPSGFDVAMSYLHVYRDVPTRSVEVEPTGEPGEVALRPVARYDRIDLIGVDGSFALGDVVLRGEAAYLFTGDPDGRDPAIGNHSFQVVAGAESSLGGGARLVVQAILDGERDDARPGGDRGDFDLDVRAMTRLSYAVDARTDLEAVWVQDADGSGLLRPGASYTFADGVSGTLDAVVFYGDDDTRFGDWRERSRLTASLRVDF